MSIEKENQRGLVLFPGSLGDAVCAQPAIKHLNREYNGNLVLAVRGEAFELYTTFPVVKNVVSLEGQGFSSLFSSSLDELEASRPFFSSFSHFVSWYGRPQVAENLRFLSRGRVHSFPFFSGQEDRHAVVYYLRCIGIDSVRCPSLKIPESALTWRDQYLQRQSGNASQKILVLHPGSGGKKKRWSAEGFRAVASWWHSRRYGKVLVLLGPAEEAETKEWIGIGEVISGLSVGQVAALLSQADLYVGNDSGVSHLAGAVGIRGVVLFGPTQPQLWRPLGGSLVVIRNSAYRSAYPSIEGISLVEITEEEVISKLLV